MRRAHAQGAGLAGPRHLPFGLFASLGSYRREWLSADMIAGLTVWAVLVPEALAYATIAGVPPVTGLYAAPAALLLYAAFGSSRHLIVGPMAATAVLSAATVSQYTSPGEEAFLALTTALALVVGALSLVAGFIRLGFVANFISEPVLKGFIIGLALTVILGQVPSLLGIEKAEGNFFEEAWGVVEALDEADGWTATIGLLSLATVLGLRYRAPRVPASLAAVLFGIVASVLFGLDGRGVAIVGEIETGLPDLGVPAGVDLPDMLKLVAGGTGVLLVAFAEGLGAAKGYAEREGYEIDVDDELRGIGAANIGAGLSGGMVVNGSLSKTAVNGSAGARTQLSGIVVAALTLVTILFLTGLFEQLPEATLAAIVIGALVELIDVGSLRRLYHLRSTTLSRVLGPAARADFLAALAALFGVLLFDTLPGLFIGIAVSVILILYRVYRPHIATLGRVPGTDQFTDRRRHPENQDTPGIVILRVESGLFFANAEAVQREVEAAASHDDVRAVLLDAEATAFVDVSAADMLVRLAGTLERDGKRLALAHEVGQVSELMSLAGDGSPIKTFGTVAEAVRYFSNSSNGEST